MEEETIRNSFLKVKQDILSLKQELNELKELINSIKQELDILCTTKLHNIAEKQDLYTTTDIPTHQQIDSTIQQIIPTHPVSESNTSTVPQEVGGLKTPNSAISIGNQGVPTDRQTDRQTDQHIIQHMQNDIENKIQEASDILDSLDSLKREIRFKFKKLTSQEMLVFSTIYQLEEENPELNDYKNIAQKLGLSQSSIRDYTQRIINKGIPIKKQKINNKKIVLSISQKLKKIASLNTIIKLREL